MAISPLVRMPSPFCTQHVAQILCVLVDLVEEIQLGEPCVLSISLCVKRMAPTSK